MISSSGDDDGLIDKGAAPPPPAPACGAVAIGDGAPAALPPCPRAAKLASEAIAHASAAEFQRALGLKRNLFVDRMFELFDANGDQNINFSEFIAGLSTFTFRAKPAEKARFSFRMYDFNGDERIDKDELGRMLRSTIEDNKLNITPEQADQLIEDTFVEAKSSTPGFINFDEYMAMVVKKPQLLEFMTIRSLNTIIT